MKPKDKQLTAILLLAGAVILMLFAGSEEKKQREVLEATINAPADAKYDPRAWMKESETDWSECALTDELGPHVHSENPEEVEEQHRLMRGLVAPQESGLILMKDGHSLFVPDKDVSHLGEKDQCYRLKLVNEEQLRREIEELNVRIQLMLIIQGLVEKVEELERRPAERPTVPNLSERPKEVIA